jgi:hypothetical protein
MDRRLFCLNTEANMLEEPGAVVPHAGILCGGCRVTGISTVTMKSACMFSYTAVG